MRLESLSLCEQLQEARNEYSRLDPRKADFPEEEEEEDAYPDLGDLEANDLIQFAYQIATGMVRTYNTN